MMKPQAQRLAIAKAIGWNPTFALLIPPDYPNDLNAMHVAEKVLNRKQCLNYVTELGYVLGNTGAEFYDLIRTSAPQRAEAFLKALGKWRDDPDERPSHRETL